MFQKALLIFEKEKKKRKEGVEQVQKRKGNGTERGRGNKKRQKQCKSREKNKQQAIQTTFFRYLPILSVAFQRAEPCENIGHPVLPQRNVHNPSQSAAGKGKGNENEGDAKTRRNGKRGNQLNRKLEVR